MAIQITIEKGLGDRPIGDIQVEYLTSEAEAVNYGKFEIHQKWMFIDKVGFVYHNFVDASPIDCIKAVIERLGWTGLPFYISGISYDVNAAGVRTIFSCEKYEGSELE